MPHKATPCLPPALPTIPEAAQGGQQAAGSSQLQAPKALPTLPSQLVRRLQVGFSSVLGCTPCLPAALDGARDHAAPAAAVPPLTAASLPRTQYCRSERHGFHC